VREGSFVCVMCDKPFGARALRASLSGANTGGTPGPGAVLGAGLNASLQVHLNIGHFGYDNGWFDFDSPICLRHYQNGTQPSGGGCAYLYDDNFYREVWSIEL
jgi:hypothetical protein